MSSHKLIKLRVLQTTPNPPCISADPEQPQERSFLGRAVQVLSFFVGGVLEKFAAWGSGVVDGVEGWRLEEGGYSKSLPAPGLAP